MSEGTEQQTNSEEIKLELPPETAQVEKAPETKNPVGKGLDIQFIFDDESKKLQAELIRAEETRKIDEEYIYEKLEEHGYGKLLVVEKGIKSILKAFNNNKVRTALVAEVVDSEISINIAEDSMAAYMTMTKSYGGHQYTIDGLHYELQKAGIVEGIIEEKLNEIIEVGFADEECIAMGLKPTNGDDSKFECLVQECYFKGPQVDDSGKVDFFDIQEFVIVEAGVELMRRCPPTPGENGYNIHGQSVPAVPGEEIMFRETEGVTISSTNPNLLISAIKGHPVVFENGVEVDTTLTLKSVDLSTGNIFFDGSLHVLGDICDNMKVNVTGNVLVEGVIQKATVYAGGDILVKNGVIGGAITEDEENDDLHFGVHLHAEGEIQARFVDNARLDAGNKILVREYIRHSRSCAVNEILLGKQAGRGQIIGGRTTAGKHVYAKLLGTQADVHTMVEVGVTPALRTQFDNISDRVEKLNKDIQGLILSFNHIRKKKENEESAAKDKDNIITLANKIKKMLKEFENYSNELAELEQRMTNTKDASINIQTMAFRNVILKIKDQQLKIKESTRGGHYILKSKRIEAE